MTGEKWAFSLVVKIPGKKPTIYTGVPGVSSGLQLPIPAPC